MMLASTLSNTGPLLTNALWLASWRTDKTRRGSLTVASTVSRSGAAGVLVVGLGGVSTGSGGARGGAVRGARGLFLASRRARAAWAATLLAWLGGLRGGGDVAESVDGVCPCCVCIQDEVVLFPPTIVCRHAAHLAWLRIACEGSRCALECLGLVAHALFQVTLQLLAFIHHILPQFLELVHFLFEVLRWHGKGNDRNG